MLTLILVIFFALIVVSSAVIGLVRGLHKSVIRVMLLVLAGLLAFLIAGPITLAVAQNLQLEGMTIGELLLAQLRNAELMAAILDATPLLQELILAVPAFVVSFVMLPILFLLLEFISWIIYLFVNQPLRKLIFRDSCDKADEANQSTGVRVGNRLGGMGIGAVCGVLIFGILMAPLFGLFTMLPSADALDQTMESLVEQDVVTQADAELIQELYAGTEGGLVKFYGLIGMNAAGKAYITSVSKVELDGQVFYLADELESIFAMVQTAMHNGTMNGILNAKDQNALFAALADQDAMDALMKDMVGSKMLSAALPEVMAYAMETVASSMHVPSDKEAVYNNMMTDVAAAVQNSEIDFEGIAAYEKANGAARSAEVMTEEAYLAELEKLEELVQTISGILNTAIAGDNADFTDSVAAYIVSDIRAQVSENGQAAVDSLNAGSVVQTISGMASSDVAGENADQLLQQLANQDQFETDVATVETIKEAIRASVKEALANEEKAAESAGTLARVISDLAGAVAGATDEDGNIKMEDLDFEMIASAVASLQNSELKAMGTAVLDMVISGDLGDNDMVSGAMSAVKEGYESGEDISGALSSAGALIQLGTSMNGSEGADQDAMVDSLTSLVEHLDEYTITLLPSILTDDTIVSMGVPKDHTDTAYDLIEKLLRELMELKGAASYDDEVNAILSLNKLTGSGAEAYSKEDIDELAGYAVSSDAIFNTLTSITSSNPFGIEFQDASARAELVKAIEDGFANSEKTQRERDVYNAIAKLLGLDLEVNLG